MDEILTAYAKLWKHRLEAAESLGDEDKRMVKFAYQVIKEDIELLFLYQSFER